MELNSNVAVLITAIALVVETLVFIRKRSPFRRMIVVMLFTIYLGAVVAITLFPLPIYLKPGQEPFYSYEVNLIPLITMVNEIASGLANGADAFYYWRLCVAYLGNILLFVPLGILLPAVSLRFARFKNMLLAGLVSSLVIELTQLLLGLRIGYLYRCIDVDDLILNTTGAVLGYGIYSILRILKKRIGKE